MDKATIYEQISTAHEAALKHLLNQRNDAGHWRGKLSSSALSTATATVALHLAGKGPNDLALVRGGLRWLLDHQNPDGGWGDTTRSNSNISTTLLCWSALSLCANDETASSGCETATTIQLASRWVADYCGSTDPNAISKAVAERYGKDRTFSVPILMLCAVCGTLGSDPVEAWRRVLPLPFELATFPRRMFAALQFPVVSYALPALIAIGYARLVNAPPPSPVAALRRRAWPKASRLLAEIQPDGGGFLEATPLTSFVTIALASAGQHDHQVVGEALPFLRRSVRKDGSWPIDTDLATWGTTLAIKAIGSSGTQLPKSNQDQLQEWLLGQQYRERHPFTDAAPGGWAWTDLPGGVPDADDTPGAMLALAALGDSGPEEHRAVSEAAQWLVDLQNRDGGIPTFCRGWGTLPFDRSSPDLTAHTLRAWVAWRDTFGADLKEQVASGTEAGLAYLEKEQQADGSWEPLWFGNQTLPTENNPVYGTAMVVLALAETGHHSAMFDRGINWLHANQHADGGWGGLCPEDASIEETALALDALASLPAGKTSETILERGARWLVMATESGTRFPASPIGFYFAKLWYYEDLYPVVWTVSALGRVRERLAIS